MIKLITYDLRVGIRDRLFQILLPIVAFGLCSVYSSGLNLGERLAIILAGDYSQLEAKNGGIPIYWLIIHIGCLLFSVEHPTRDLSLSGRQIIIRSQSRCKWWLSKCVWCLFNTMIYYCVGIITEAFLCIVFNDELTFELRTVAVRTALDVSAENVRNTIPALPAVLVIVALPLLTMYALNLLQMIMGIVANQIIALLGGITVLAASLYIRSPLLIGNYSALKRSAVFNIGGLNLHTGILIMSVEAAILIFIGIEIFNRIDILEPRKNGE